jgi:superfamily I DNA/RNA helicase
MTRFGFYDRKDFPYFRTEHAICYRLLGLKKEQVFNKDRLADFGQRYNYQFSGAGDPQGDRFQEQVLLTLADYLEFFTELMQSKMRNFEDTYREFMRSHAVPDGFTKTALRLYLERRTRFKEENKLWSFSDMIVGTIQQGLFPEGARVLIVDEAQDCSPLLWALIKLWSERVEGYFIAGDPLQTLYFWSGSDPNLFFDFEGEEEVLKKSYRLTGEVKGYAEKLIATTPLRFPEFEASGRKGIVSRETFTSVDWTNLTDAFLLIRTRWLISQVVDQFIFLGVPFVSERGKQSPLVTGKGRAFLSLHKLGHGESVMDGELKNLVKYTRGPYLERGAKTTVRDLPEGTSYPPWQLNKMGFTSRFFDAVQTGAFLDVLCLNVEDWEKSYLNRIYRRLGAKAFERENNLVVTTIHGSKGRERPTVFVMPDMTQTVWDAYSRQKLPETLLYYVAATRAINHLTILAPQREHFFPLPKVTKEVK